MNSRESESIEILREAVATASNPVMLYSIGKDSSVLLHLARKAFHPAVPQFPLLHVDTGWKSKTIYDHRDRMVAESGMRLIVHNCLQSLVEDVAHLTHGNMNHTEVINTQAFKQALERHGFDVVFSGARRDEEESRANEHIFSFRGPENLRDPKLQRPELWNLYNTRIRPNETIRVFPISNWTELDVWEYIRAEQIPIVPLYLAAERSVVKRGGQWISVDDDRFTLRPGERVEVRRVRFRTLGCWPLTAAVESEADTLDAVIAETFNASISERQGQLIGADVLEPMDKK